jgi:predicted DNA-binding transcriptional regulator AlpA
MVSADFGYRRNGSDRAGANAHVVGGAMTLSGRFTMPEVTMWDGGKRRSGNVAARCCVPPCHSATTAGQRMVGAPYLDRLTRNRQGTLCGALPPQSIDPCSSASPQGAEERTTMSTEQTELMSRRDVCEFFGKIHPSTLWRGIRQGRYPAPIHVGPQLRRWSRADCEAVLRRMSEARS